MARLACGWTLRLALTFAVVLVVAVVVICWAAARALDKVAEDIDDAERRWP